jgi:predicted ArsR family transcriptional regulator
MDETGPETGPGPDDSGFSAIGSLADPVRRRLYDYVSSCADAVGREQAAAAAEVPLHSARFHLDRLVEAGLLEVEFRRLSGRSGPGAGRPAKLYRRSGREVSVSLPGRSYDLLGGVLAAAVERSLAGEPLPEAVSAEAREAGRQAGSSYDGPPAAELDRTAAVLADEGFEPARDGEELELRNCPFDALAHRHPQLVCGINLDYVGGVLDGLRCRHARAGLEPAPDRCCIRIHG